VDVKLTIEIDREADGRWIAEVPELNVLLYGDSKQDAIQRAQSAAREIVRGTGLPACLARLRA
jgi:predicted RNase H-like HicB family nuclease